MSIVSSVRVRQRTIALVAVFAVLTGVVACTSSDDPAPTPVRTTVEKAWTAAGIDPVSAVSDVGGVAVVYGTTPAGLVIYGLDPATGTQLWSRPATMGVDADRMWVSAIGDAVPYYRPTGTDRLAQLVVADAKTGTDLSVSADRYWRGTPWVCADDPDWVCATSFVQSPGGRWEFLDFRVNRDTGATQPNTDATIVDQVDDHAMVGGDLFWNRQQDTVAIGRKKDAAQAWLKPVAELFGPGSTTFSTYWYQESTDGTFSIVTLSGATGTQSGEEFDLATGIVSSAINLSDGSTRWIAPGTALGCLGNHPNLGWRRGGEAATAYAFRCRYTGTALRSGSALDGSQFATSNLMVELERVDPASGTTVWTTPLGDARTLAADLSAGVDEAVVDDTHLFVPNSAGGLLVDLETGVARAPLESDILWCTDTREFSRPETYFAEDSKQVTTARRSGVFRPCKLDGSDAPVPTIALPSAISTGFGGEQRVVAMTGAVSGFLAPPVTGSDSSEDSASSPSETAAESPSATSAAIPPESPATIEAVAPAWSTTGFEPLTGVTLVGDTAVLYGTVGPDLYLLGVDPVTGAERWRQRASAAGLAPTTRLVVRDIDGAVAYLRPTETLNQNTQLVLADVATGTDLTVTEARWWTGIPQVCDSDATLLCGWSYDWKDHMFSVTATRVDRASGAVSVGPVDPAPPESPYDTLFGDLVQVNGAPTETIGMLKDGSLKWSATVADLLGAGVSMSYGWLIGHRPGTPPVVYISTKVAWEFDTTTGYPPLDLAANQVTVGLNADTGAVLWREPGTWTNCRGNLGAIEKLSTPGSPFPALRCRYSGVLNSVQPGSRDELTVPTDLSVTLERVDLSTGKAIWSIPLGAQPSLAVDAPGLAMTLLDDHRMLFSGQVIDLDTGAVRAAAPEEVFWCPGRQTFEQSVAALDRTGNRFDRRAGGVAFTCDAAAEPASTSPAAVPLAISAVTDDGLRLVSTPSGVVAYRLPL